MDPARSDTLNLGTFRKPTSCEQSKEGLDESNPTKQKGAFDESNPYGQSRGRLDKSNPFK